MSLFTKLSKFARSPQGKQVMDHAQKLAKDPNTKRKIADVRARFGGRTAPRGSSKTPR